MVIILMGVSGSGKSVVGNILSKAIASGYAEGDEFHSEANVEKMRGGTPLNDEDRWPWLDSMAEAIDGWRAEGKTMILACSALKRVYRDILMGSRDDVLAVHLKGSKELISSRLSVRKHEYMPSTLLQSQFDTLEEPDDSENVITVSIDATPETIVKNIVDRLKARGLV
ncbi:MAG: gluconokinase [Rhodospirillales bacterium]|jgi:carbohydrate kinase (thermoresistant glucokinase family)|nr:gluconokinase [Rhodospirillales bacterium]